MGLVPWGGMALGEPSGRLLSFALEIHGEPVLALQDPIVQPTPAAAF